MRGESMSAIERVDCALSLEKPDRVPIWPDVTTSAAARLTGEKNWEAANQGFDAQQDLKFRQTVNHFDRDHLALIHSAPRLGV